jgi:hypothetical protein
MHCPLTEEGREEMLQAANTRNFSILMNDPKGIKACVRWVMEKKLLTQFSFTQEPEEEEEERVPQETWQEEILAMDSDTTDMEYPYTNEQETLGSDVESEEEESEL